MTQALSSRIVDLAGALGLITGVTIDPRGPSAVNLVELLSSLANLEKLELDGVEINAEVAQAIFGLTALEQLIISNCTFDQTLLLFQDGNSLGLRALTRLDQLHLGDCIFLTPTVCSEITQMQRIRTLTLPSTVFNIETTPQICQIPGLSSLTITLPSGDVQRETARANLTHFIGRWRERNQQSSLRVTLD